MSKKNIKSDSTNICIDGKTYSVNIEKAVKDGYLKPILKRKIGQIYSYDDELFILSVLSIGPTIGTIGFVCVEDGMLFSDDTVEVSDIDDIHITESQWKYIGGDKMIYVAEDIYSAIKN
jgi:hypothetical protein